MTAPSRAGSVDPVRRSALVAAYVAAAAGASTQARAALASFVPAPPHIQYVSGTAPGLPADAMAPAATDAQTGTVYFSQPLDKFARAHETGHVLDAQVLSDGDRVYFQKLMQAPSGAWNQGTGVRGGFQSPHEWFADYYAAAASRLDLTHQGVSSYAKIGPTRLKRFEAALARLGQRQHLKPYQP